MTDSTNTIEKSASDLSAMEKCYQRARHLMRGMGTNEIVLNTVLYPLWIENTDCFWYVRHNWEGKEYRLVNAKSATNEIAFDHAALATALAEASGQDVTASDLPIANVELTLRPLVVAFTAFDKSWRFESASGACSEVELPHPNNEVVSPNGKYVAIRRDYNLWLRDLATGEENALTTDGELYSEYADESPAWGSSRGSVFIGAQLSWSPDSKRIFTIQRDARRVKTFPIVHHVPANGTLRPEVEHYKVALPGDEHIETNRLLVIDVETGKNQVANYNQLPTTRNGWGFFDSNLGWWGRDSQLAYFVDVDRYYKYARIVEFDTHTGICRVLFEETSDTQVNLMLNGDAYPSYLPLPETDEILWFSERTGWAHFYLYDLKTGELKNPVTSGPGLARNIVKYVPAKRELFVQMAGRVEGRDPYYRDLVRVNIDTGAMTTLVSSDHEYLAIAEPEDIYKTFVKGAFGCPDAACGISSSGDYAVVTRTRADQVPITYLIDRSGATIMDLEMADVSRLPEGWQWPEPVKLTAADGETDIYGLVFRPSNFDPNKSYPVIDHTYNQPDLIWTSKGSFNTGLFGGISYLDAAVTAELGFIVIQIDGRGTGEREKSFLDHNYGWIDKASDIDDHVAGIKQLAARYPYMDLTRVGVVGLGGGGGSGVLQGLLKHPEFYRVGAVQCHHDRRFMGTQMWSDKYEGPSPLEEKYLYPEDEIAKLQGKLLLMNGMLDACCPPAIIFRLVEALHKANKDFDMILLPNLGHDTNAYLIRRAWDYLVRHLTGVEPPKEFNLDSPSSVEES